MERKIEALEKRRLEEMDDLKSKIEAVEHHKNQLDRGQTEQTGKFTGKYLNDLITK